jgi:predicted transcriptional regulator
LPPLFRKTAPFCQYLLTIQAKQYIFIDIMGKKSVTLLPKTGKILEQMGEQIRLARMRRKISVALAAERAGVSRASVWAVEKGSAAVAIGIYAAVLHAISGMDTDLLKVAANDELGQKLHDIELLKKYHPEGK